MDSYRRQKVNLRWFGGVTMLVDSVMSMPLPYCPFVLDRVHKELLWFARLKRLGEN